MNVIGEWVTSIAAVTMIISVVQALCPKNSAGRAVGFCSAIILTAVMLTPIRNIDFNVLSEYSKEIDCITKKRAGELNQKSEKIYKDIIEERTEAYIFQRAGEQGISCDIIIKCKENVPHSAHIKTSDEESAYIVAGIIETECGIPKERQTYEKEWS